MNIKLSKLINELDSKQESISDKIVAQFIKRREKKEQSFKASEIFGAINKLSKNKIPFSEKTALAKQIISKLENIGIVVN